MTTSARAFLSIALTGLLWFAGAPLAHGLTLIRDAETEHTLRLYSDPIFKVAGLKPSGVHIFIVQDDAVNAFVAGGANMFIFTGLILASETPDMLLGVIAHETGHIASGHLARGGEKMKDAQIGSIMAMVLGAAAAAATGKPEAAAAVITGTQTTVTRNFLAYTRIQEEAADQAGLRYLDKLGISAEGMLKTFQLLQRNERMRGGRPDPYMISHPLNSARIEHVRHHIEKSKIAPGSYPSSYIQAHKRMVAKLYAFLHSPEQTLQRYPVSENSASARLARAVAFYKMPDLTRAIAEMESLIEEYPKDAFLYDLKGQIQFENGKVDAALEAYTKANQLMPGNALILTDLAKVELAQKSPALDRAVIQLEKAIRVDNTNPTSWRLLATAYGRQGNDGGANLALAEEALLLNDPELALAKIEITLASLKKEGPLRQRAIDIKTSALQMKKKKEEDAR